MYRVMREDGKVFKTRFSSLEEADAKAKSLTAKSKKGEVFFAIVV
jgi:hypothetical protein